MVNPICFGPSGKSTFAPSLLDAMTSVRASAPSVIVARPSSNRPVGRPTESTALIM
ncbi:Uncharacterised protein [Mycobacterium tuberculosis]|nr:Uncharacterised protein [Mycobacterium tuberculosis]